MNGYRPPYRHQGVRAHSLNIGAPITMNTCTCSGKLQCRLAPLALTIHSKASVIELNIFGADLRLNVNVWSVQSRPFQIMPNSSWFLGWTGIMWKTHSTSILANWAPFLRTVHCNLLNDVVHSDIHLGRRGKVPIAAVVDAKVIWGWKINNQQPFSWLA